MDWNENERGDASRSANLYGRKGRRGKKMVGKPNQDRRRATHQMKMLASWRRIFRKRHGRWPSDEEIWAAAHQRGGFGKDVDDFVKNTPVIIIKHGLDNESRRAKDAMEVWLEDERARKEKEDEECRIEKERVDAEYARMELFQDNKIPPKVLFSIKEGRVDKQAIAAIFGIDTAKMDRMLSAL